MTVIIDYMSLSQLYLINSVCITLWKIKMLQGNFT